MSPATLVLLGLSLSVDAFAAALGKGAAFRRASVADALKIGACFGLFEAITPAVGWSIGIAFGARIASVDHWIAFVLLAGVGINMILQATRRAGGARGGDAGGGDEARPRAGTLRLALAATATSLDAAVVGVTLGVVGAGIVQACLVIGLVTAAMSFGGVLLGRTAAPLLGRRAQVIGGLALVAVGGKILVEHLAA